MQLECWIPQVLPFERTRETDFFEPPSFLPLDNLGATCSRGPYRRSPVCMMHENRRDLLDLLTHWRDWLHLLVVRIWDSGLSPRTVA